MREIERESALSKLMPVKKARAKQFTLIIHLSFFETYETQYIQTHTHRGARMDIQTGDIHSCARSHCGTLHPNQEQQQEKENEKKNVGN